MGICLCKDKIEEGVIPSSAEHDRFTVDELILNRNIVSSRNMVRGDRRSSTSHRIDNYGLGPNTAEEIASRDLKKTVDELVRDTLDVIGTIVDNEPEPPHSMVLLHVITDKPSGWIELIHSLIRVVPIEHPMGPSVIALLLDDSPLPSKESVLQVAAMVQSLSKQRNTSRERNLCVILGCLAEKLAGPNSVAMLTNNTLTYLIDNLKADNPDVTLLSLIALEKFALTTENKGTIKRRLAECSKNPLLELEQYVLCESFTLRQIGFCARWCLDNYFILDDRKYSYETVDNQSVNVMLNTKDVSEYLKISPDGLEARCDAYTFESVRCTLRINSGCWYYEVFIITPGVMQIGWATKLSKFLSDDGFGIGDDKYSIAFDGCRKLIWYNAKSQQHNLPVWESGTILGCLLDLENEECIFSINGERSEPYKQVFENCKQGFFAAASFMSFQQCRFNFGSTPFKFPPNDKPFKNFNENASLEAKDKVVLPRHIYLETLRKLSVREDSCTICFDRKGTTRIEPCKHKGFCLKCLIQLQYCPMCRAKIIRIVREEGECPITEDVVM